MLIQGKIGFTDANVTDSVDSASANASKLNLVSNVLPVVSLVLGLVLLVIGILMFRGAGAESSSSSTPLATSKV